MSNEISIFANFELKEYINYIKKGNIYFSKLTKIEYDNFKELEEEYLFFNEEKFYNQTIIETPVDTEIIQTEKYFLKKSRELSKHEKEFKAVIIKLREKYTVENCQGIDKDRDYKNYITIKNELGIIEHRLLKSEIEIIMNKISNHKNKGFQLKQNVIRLIKQNLKLNETAFVTLTIDPKYYDKKIKKINETKTISKIEKEKRINALNKKNIEYQKIIKDVKLTNSLFKKQFQNARSKYEFFKNSSYLASVEKQKNGNVHYHVLLFNINEKDFDLYKTSRKDKQNNYNWHYNSKFLEKVWVYGMNDFVLLDNWNKQKDREQTAIDIAKYMSKYITKTEEFERLAQSDKLDYLKTHKYENLILKSRNLAKFEKVKALDLQIDKNLIDIEYNGSFKLPTKSGVLKQIKTKKIYLKNKENK